MQGPSTAPLDVVWLLVDLTKNDGVVRRGAHHGGLGGSKRVYTARRDRCSKCGFLRPYLGVWDRRCSAGQV